MKKLEIQQGDKFNKLTVIKELDRRFTKGGNSIRVFEVKCDCGNVKNIDIRQLTTGKTKSCGCWNLEKSKTQFKTHGLSGTRIHKIWKDMNKRCSNPNSINYKNYGARGIEVCEEWKKDFLSFYKWSMENGYDDLLSIERLDVNGNYEPRNCSWITNQEQKYNTRKQKPFIGINPNGEKFEGKCIKLFAEEHGLKKNLISDCLNKRQHSHRGWKFERL